MYQQRHGRPTGGGPRRHGAYGHHLYEDALRAYPPRRGHHHSSLDDGFDLAGLEDELKDELDDGLDDGLEDGLDDELDDDSLGFRFLGSDLSLEDDDHSEYNVPPGFGAAEREPHRLGYRHDDIPGRGRHVWALLALDLEGVVDLVVTVMDNVMGESPSTGTDMLQEDAIETKQGDAMEGMEDTGFLGVMMKAINGLLEGVERGIMVDKGD
ncbi:MAG: hypothetical protein Q9178_002821 [Gyalolechia marmorata]